jgi:hypothetical protein
MDLLEAKSRVAEALVESIFRRARFRVEPFHDDRPPLRVGREDFSPDFSAVRKLEDGTERVALVSVKYRPSIEQFLSVESQRGDRSVFLLARRQWSSLYLVLVTDRPEASRSCFQAIALGAHRAGQPFRAVDLVDQAELMIFPNNVEDHVVLGRRIFDLLGASRA